MVETVLRLGCQKSIGHRRQRRERGMVVRRLRSCQSTTVSYGAAPLPHCSRGRRRRCPPPRQARPASVRARRSAAIRWRSRRRRGRESPAPHHALNSRRRAIQARHRRSCAPLCHRSAWVAAPRSAREKGRRPLRLSRRRRFAARVGISSVVCAKTLLEKEKTWLRQHSPMVATTTISPRNVKEKRQSSLTRVTTVGRRNKSAARPSVADVTRLPLRSHTPGCYLLAIQGGGLAPAKFSECVY